MKDAKVWDKVVFELREDLSRPRWDFGTDRGGSGKYRTGTIKIIDTSIITVRADDKGFDWNWPALDNELYNKNLPGYLTLSLMSAPVGEGERGNNDGREFCFDCNAPTRPCGGFTYNVDYRTCTKCGR
jgi:hypothetical protein